MTFQSHFLSLPMQPSMRQHNTHTYIYMYIYTYIYTSFTLLLCSWINLPIVKSSPHFDLTWFWHRSEALHHDFIYKDGEYLFIQSPILLATVVIVHAHLFILLANLQNPIICANITLIVNISHIPLSKYCKITSKQILFDSAMPFLAVNYKCTNAHMH